MYFKKILLISFFILSFFPPALSQINWQNVEFQVNWGYSFLPSEFSASANKTNPIDIKTLNDCKILVTMRALTLNQLQCDGVLDQSSDFGVKIKERLTRHIIAPLQEAGIEKLGLIDVSELQKKIDGIQFFQFKQGVLASRIPSKRQSAVNFIAGVPGFDKPTVVYNSLFLQQDPSLLDNDHLRAILDLHEVYDVLKIVADTNYEASMSTWWIASEPKAENRKVMLHSFDDIFKIPPTHSTSASHIGGGGDIGELVFKYNLFLGTMGDYKKYSSQYGINISEIIEAIFQSSVSTYPGQYTLQHSPHPGVCYSHSNSRFEMKVSRNWFFSARPTLEEKMRLVSASSDRGADALQIELLTKYPKILEITRAAVANDLAILCRQDPQNHPQGCCEPVVKK